MAYYNRKRKYGNRMNNYTVQNPPTIEEFSQTVKVMDRKSRTNPNPIDITVTPFAGEPYLHVRKNRNSISLTWREFCKLGEMVGKVQPAVDGCVNYIVTNRLDRNLPPDNTLVCDLSEDDDDDGLEVEEKGAGP